MKLREMAATDWPEIARIYREGIETGIATFEKSVPSYEDWDTAHLPFCRLVATNGADTELLGWAALSAVSGRCVYGGVAEISVYIGRENRGKGVGRFLMEHLIQKSEEAGIWTLQSGIFPQNKGSIALHKQVGFRFLGKRERIGKRDGIWYDNLIFERRSTVAGMD